MQGDHKQSELHEILQLTNFDKSKSLKLCLQKVQAEYIITRPPLIGSQSAIVLVYIHIRSKLPMASVLGSDIRATPLIHDVYILHMYLLPV